MIIKREQYAHLMGKTETEVSRWLSRTHNLTMATICKISAALGENIIRVCDYSYKPACEFESLSVAES